MTATGGDGEGREGAGGGDADGQTAGKKGTGVWGRKGVRSGMEKRGRGGGTEKGKIRARQSVRVARA